MAFITLSLTLFPSSMQITPEASDTGRRI